MHGRYELGGFPGMTSIQLAGLQQSVEIIQRANGQTRAKTHIFQDPTMTGTILSGGVLGAVTNVLISCRRRGGCCKTPSHPTSLALIIDGTGGQHTVINGGDSKGR